jgi:hypothetical protein
LTRRAVEPMRNQANAILDAKRSNLDVLLRINIGILSP